MRRRAAQLGEIPADEPGRRATMGPGSDEKMRSLLERAAPGGHATLSERSVMLLPKA